MIQLIYAYAPTKNHKGEYERAFGLNQSLPWGHISQDLKNFKARTENTNLIMGAKTFMSLKSRLPGRMHIVIQDQTRLNAKTQDGYAADHYISQEVFHQFLEGTLDLGYGDKNYSVIGGPALLEQALPYTNRIVLTIISKKHYVCSDVKLSTEFAERVSVMTTTEFEPVESHFYRIDELTSITETVYEVLCSN
ncbi:hypothetical protein fHeYen901_254 [Yersinia phage fHe-Yen9-01]|uniref:dihydrofolate reductase n=1 Tax=Yersinia phage fHe-Yen9-01 TaxID=1965363 RepID=A0A1V0DY02_9CAUD|nr:dihydrofolate reductase [Yersinia phage fHe-Yen9-01]ARB06027.1 hypothetical protein fHeYen901_254 [Yersinia phage fHe-Yen9-01]